MTETSTLYRSPVHPATWLGVPGASITVARSKNAADRCGERVTLIVWHADADDKNGKRAAGQVSATHIKGDGRRFDAEVFATNLFDSLAQAEAWAAERLA